MRTGWADAGLPHPQMSVMLVISKHSKSALNIRRGFIFNTAPLLSSLEYWSTGVLEYWVPIIPSFHHSVTPSIHFFYGTCITKFINGSTVTLWSGGTKVVVKGNSITAGPFTTAPEPSRS